jgi:hypothetical protein
MSCFISIGYIIMHQLLGMKFISRYYFRLSFYLTGVLVCIYFGLAAFGGKPDLQYTCTASSGHILTFLCASYRSLYLLSSLCLVRLCDVLFLVTANIIPTCYSISKSYLLQCYKTHIFQNAYIFSSKLATRISQGLNVTHLSVLVLCKLNSGSLAQDMYLLEGIGLIFNGRIKGHITTRFVLAMNALCVSSFRYFLAYIGEHKLTNLYVHAF